MTNLITWRLRNIVYLCAQDFGEQLVVSAMVIFNLGLYTQPIYQSQIWMVKRHFQTHKISKIHLPKTLSQKTSKGDVLPKRAIKQKIKNKKNNTGSREWGSTIVQI